MSRVGKYPVSVPDGVTVEVSGQTVTARGGLGERALTLVDEVSVSQENGNLWVKPRDNSKRARQMWGTSRNLVNNLVRGVAGGFTIDLEVVGIGYRASVQGQNLALQLGYSRDIQYAIPEGITIRCERPTLISISGADRQQVGQVAADIRALRPPEPYKGKGIKYATETILRKEGKKK